MLISYISLAIRRIFRERMYSVIKITGLSVALCCLFMIFLFVSDELSFDRHNQSPEQIYRIMQMPDAGNDNDPAATTPFPLYGKLINEQDHIIESATRFFNQRAPKFSLNYVEKDIQFNETRFFFADSTVFDVFDVEFVLGDRESALRNPNGLVMTTTTAERYFGSDDPIGKVIRFDGRFNLVVSGVVEPLPKTSHFQFDLLGAFEAANGMYVGGIPTDWEWNICWTYVRVKDGIDEAELNAVLRNISSEIQPLREASPIYYAAQPLLDIRLNSDLAGEIGPTSSKQYLTIVFYIGLFILLIASVNFINLSLASSMGRSKEVGVRKVLGADRGQLILQHLMEALLICLLSLIIAVLIIILMMPYFNGLTGKQLDITHLFNGEFWAFASLITLIVTLIGGIYPALIMSSWSPLDLFRTGNPKQSSSFKVSNGLIVVQFAVASMLIAGTWVVYNQLDLIRNQRLGFDQEQVVMVPSALTRLIFFYDTFKEQVESHPQVASMAGVSAVLGTDYNTYGYEIENYNEGSSQSIAFYYVTYDMIETFGIPLAEGRFFDRDFGTDQTDAIVINESFVKMAGWESNSQAIGKEIKRDGESKRVIGVIRDFNYSNLRRQIEPLVLEMPFHVPTLIGYIGIKMTSADHQDAIDWIGQQWKTIDPTRPFEYFYLDERVQAQYENETRLAGVTGFYSVVSIIISCIGLFGLASYTTARKSKTIGIRKVLGASVSNIVLILSSEFLKLVIIANIIALPTIYWLMNLWLQNFAYRTDISFLILLVTFFMTLIIAFLTVSLQSYKAASRNPIESLRYE